VLMEDAHDLLQEFPKMSYLEVMARGVMVRVG